VSVAAVITVWGDEKTFSSALLKNIAHEKRRVLK
jgi:hypothetical protein